MYVGEKVSEFTQPMRSAAENVDQFLLSSSRVRCSVARQLVNLSAGVWPNAIEAAARQLVVTSQLGTLSASAARVRRAEASVGQNEMPSATARLATHDFLTALEPMVLAYPDQWRGWSELIDDLSSQPTPLQFFRS